MRYGPDSHELEIADDGAGMPADVPGGGHGTYQLSLEIVGARVNGSCSSARPPLAQQELLRLSGPARR